MLQNDRPSPPGMSPIKYSRPQPNEEPHNAQGNQRIQGIRQIRGHLGTSILSLGTWVHLGTYNVHRRAGTVRLDCLSAD